MMPSTLDASGADALISSACARTSWQGKVLEDNKETNTEGCAAAVASCKSGANDKRLASIAAHLAEHDCHVVRKWAGGGFNVKWRGLSREGSDRVERKARARCVGVRR